MASTCMQLRSTGYTGPRAPRGDCQRRATAHRRPVPASAGIGFPPQ